MVHRWTRPKIPEVGEISIPEGVCVNFSFRRRGSTPPPQPPKIFACGTQYFCQYLFLLFHNIKFKIKPSGCFYPLPFWQFCPRKKEGQVYSRGGVYFSSRGVCLFQPPERGAPLHPPPLSTCGMVTKSWISEKIRVYQYPFARIYKGIFVSTHIF